MATPAKKKKTRSKLGRGLSALVDQGNAQSIEVLPELSTKRTAHIVSELTQKSEQDNEQPGQQVLEVDVTHIEPNPHQPRRTFDEKALEELSQSILEHGLMQPIAVRKIDMDRYELIAGERRWRATCRTGSATIRVIVLDVDDTQSAQLALIENIQREDLNPIERALGFALLTTEFGMTQDHVAKRVGISRSSVANMLRLLELDEEIQSLIASDQLSTGHGKALLSCKNPEQRTLLAKMTVDKNWTVRILENAASQANQHSDDIDGAPEAALNQKVNLEQSRLASVLNDLESRMGEQLSTKVKLKTDKSGTKGSITIEFYDLDHFDGLMTRIGIHQEQELE